MIPVMLAVMIIAVFQLCIIVNEFNMRVFRVFSSQSLFSGSLPIFYCTKKNKK